MQKEGATHTRKKNYSSKHKSNLVETIDPSSETRGNSDSASNIEINKSSKNLSTMENREIAPAIFSDSKQTNIRRRKNNKRSEKAPVGSTKQGETESYPSYRIINRLQMMNPSAENRYFESVETEANTGSKLQTVQIRQNFLPTKSRSERTAPTVNRQVSNSNQFDSTTNNAERVLDSSIENTEYSGHVTSIHQSSTRDLKTSRRRKRNQAPLGTSVTKNSLNPTAPFFVPSMKSTTSTSDPQPSQSNITCTICAEENVSFLAIGQCNHPICSICALRIRFKTKSFDCSICKSLIDVMVVFPYERSFHDYFSFSLPEDDWVYTRPPYPGTELLSVARMIFFDCSSHLKSLEKLISICCPLQDCGRMFPSNRRLLDHLNHQHMGLTICNICLDHRQLFIPEHKVVTKSELKQHMNGSKESMQSAITSSKGEGERDAYFTQGHPRCEFCRSHYFDSSALYSHMQSAHETCHLCPGRMMFRYYRNIASIQQHYRKNHIVCDSCYEIEERRLSGEAVAFNTYSEYSTHMTEYHGLSSRDCRIRFENSLQRQTASSSYVSSSQQDAGFFDLDMGSANPYSFPSSSNESNNNNSSSNNSNNRPNRSNPERNTAAVNAIMSNALSSGASSNLTVSIPPNMQIAGRISGSGRFTAKSESDLLMQAMAEEQANAVKKEYNIMNQWAFKSIRQPDSFPELAVSNRASTSAAVASSVSAPSSSSSSTAPHPLSLVNSKQKSLSEKKKAAEELESARMKELELRKVENDLLLYQALLQEEDVSDWRRQRTSSPATLQEELFLSLGGLEGATNNEHHRLLHVLWPPQLIHWGQANMAELAKLESRMHDLIAEKAMHSYQLKPIDKARRDIVHWSAPFIPPNPNQTLVPVIYLSLKNAVPPQPTPAQKFEVLGAGRLTPGSGVFTIAELISKIRNLLKLEYNTIGSRMMNVTEANTAVPLDILRSGQVGPSTVEFLFRNLRSASEAFRAIYNSFFPNFSLQKAESGSREYTAGQLAHYFEIIPGFVVESVDSNTPPAVALAENLTLPTGAALYEDSHNNSSYSSYSVDHTRFDSDTSSSWTRVLPTRAIKSKGAVVKVATAAELPTPVVSGLDGEFLNRLSMREDWDDDQSEQGGPLVDPLENIGSGVEAGAEVDDVDKEWNDFLSSKRSGVNKECLYSAKQAVDKWSVEDHQHNSGADDEECRGMTAALPLAVAVSVTQHTAEDDRQRSTAKQRRNENVFSILDEQDQVDEEAGEWNEDEDQDTQPNVLGNISVIVQCSDELYVEKNDNDLS